MTGQTRSSLRVAMVLTWMSLAAYLVTSHAVHAFLKEVAHAARHLN